MGLCLSVNPSLALRRASAGYHNLLGAHNCVTICTYGISARNVSSWAEVSRVDERVSWRQRQNRKHDGTGPR